MFHQGIIFLLASFTCVFGDIGSSSKLATPHVLPNATVQNKNTNSFSEADYRKIFSFTKKTKIYQHFSYEEMRARIINVTTWEVPLDIKNSFPLYLAGYDYDKRPVWVFEVGKVDFRTIIAQGEEKVAQARRYLFRVVSNIIKSFVVMDTPEEEIREAVFIFDMEGASLGQVDYAPSWAEFARLIRKYWDFTIQFVGGVIVLNANYVAKLAVDVARPVVGALLERVEIYGSNKNFYLPKLLKRMSIKNIPPWYGGSKDFKPLIVLS
ncbi:unnamed protein product [Allacma fusca]|uniref:CRAL-TRIO domain-containing protein n=1 Tax=Allacma fusca TaxID=39272 RepID=A0A8J2PKN9_9HEXA|nr:unnamed protein product [Allacma fusca]